MCCGDGRIMLFMSQAPRPAELMMVSLVNFVSSPERLSRVVISQPAFPFSPRAFIAVTVLLMERELISDLFGCRESYDCIK